MTETTKEKIKDFLWSAFLVGIYATTLLFTLIIPIAQAFFPPPDTCESVSIPYETEYVDDATRMMEDNYTETAGQAGVKNVCHNRAGDETKNELTTAPINEIVYRGTKTQFVEPVQTYSEPDSYGGSVCNDGSYSPSVGRGACSWHGGVAY